MCVPHHHRYYFRQRGDTAAHRVVPLDDVEVGEEKDDAGGEVLVLNTTGKIHKLQDDVCGLWCS